MSTETSIKPDPTTQSNYLEVTTEHVEFIWNVDFTNRVIEGSALHTMIVKAHEVHEVIFDTGDLHIESAEVNGNLETFVLGNKHPVMGSSLFIPLPSSATKGSKIQVKIFYKTDKDCVALQWLEKEHRGIGSLTYLANASRYTLVLWLLFKIHPQ